MLIFFRIIKFLSNSKQIPEKLAPLGPTPPLFEHYNLNMKMLKQKKNMIWD
jgi:hypothetical protein